MKKQKRADASTLGAKTLVVLSSLSLTAGGWAYFAHTEGQPKKAIAQEPVIVITATSAQLKPSVVSASAPRANSIIALPEQKPIPTLVPIVRLTLPPLVKKIIPAPPLREVVTSTSDAPQAQAALVQPVAPAVEAQAPAAQPQPPAAQPEPPAAQPEPPVAQPQPPAAQPEPPAAQPPAAQPQPPAPPPVVQPAPPPAPAPPADTGSSKGKKP